MNSITFTNIPYLLSIGKYDPKGLKHTEANIASIKQGGRLIQTRLIFLSKSIKGLDPENIMVQMTISHIEDSTKYLKTINDWLENIPKKSVHFGQDVKPYQRKLPYVKSDKKLWNWYLDDQPWADPIDYFISENYDKVKHTSRPHIFKILKTKWHFLSEAEKEPYKIKAKTLITRDRDGIGYIKGDNNPEQKEKFIIEIIQPAINNLRNINYETCINCNISTHTTFHNVEDDGMNLTKDVTNTVLKISLMKAVRASQIKQKVQTECCKCGRKIWTSSWYFKGVLNHQQLVDWHMITRKYVKKVDSDFMVTWEK